MPITISTTRNIGSAKEDPPAGARNIKRLGEDTGKKASLGRMRRRRAQSYGHHPDRYIRQNAPVVESLMFGKGKFRSSSSASFSPCSSFLEPLVHCRPVSTLNTETIPTLFNGQRTINDRSSGS